MENNIWSYLLDNLFEIVATITTILVLIYTSRNIRESFRPYVHLSVKIEGQKIMMCLQNTGSRPAYNVEFEFDNPLYPRMLDSSQESEVEAFNMNTKSFHHSLAPYSNFEWFFDIIYTRYKTVNYHLLDNEIVSITIKYADKYNGTQKYIESYKLNLKNYISYIVFETENENIGKILNKTNTELKNINQSIKNNKPTS